MGLVGGTSFDEFPIVAAHSKRKKNTRNASLCFFIAKSMLMRDVFAALLRYGEFASQFHLRPLAIPRLGSYTDPTWTDRGHTVQTCIKISSIIRGRNSSRIAAG